MKKLWVGLGLLMLPFTALALEAEELERLAPTLAPAVAQRALEASLCAQGAGQSVDKLIVVDMALKSTQRRLWAFDLKGKPSLILNAQVAHGAGSDPDADGKATDFSNQPNSHMTSLGLYRVAEAYQGKHGLSRRLDGLFARFNSKARERAVVIHSAAYVGPARVGRSHGCPAVSAQTLAALEQLGLRNTVLWIDGPDTTLAQEVKLCAAKHQALNRYPLLRKSAFVLSSG